MLLWRVIRVANWSVWDLRVRVSEGKNSCAIWKIRVRLSRVRTLSGLWDCVTGACRGSQEQAVAVISDCN